MAAGLESNCNEQQKLIDQLRRQVTDVISPEYEDTDLAKWLTARSNNVAKAEVMLRKNLKWREKWKMDTVHNDYKPAEVLTKYFPGGLVGYDKEGSPIWLTPAGKLDIKGLTMASKKQEIIKYNMYFVETVAQLCKKQTKKTGKLVDSAVYIGDGDGLTLKTIFAKEMDFFLKMLQIVEANYPEALKQCYIINAPRYWNIIYNICKPFLSEATKKKVVIMGADWREQLLKVIDPDQLPEHWGGTMRDPDGNPQCPSKVCLGGIVPKSFYRSIDQCVDVSKLQTVNIAAGSAHAINIIVKEQDSVLRWAFQTKDCDISFSIKLRKNNSNQVEEVVAAKRVNSHLIFEEGSFECEYLGIHTMHFDNSYSWMTSKEVSFVVELIEPSAQMARAAQVKDVDVGDL